MLGIEIYQFPRDFHRIVRIVGPRCEVEGDAVWRRKSEDHSLMNWVLGERMVSDHFWMLNV